MVEFNSMGGGREDSFSEIWTHAMKEQMLRTWFNTLTHDTRTVKNSEVNSKMVSLVKIQS